MRVILNSLPRAALKPQTLISHLEIPTKTPSQESSQHLIRIQTLSKRISYPQTPLRLPTSPTNNLQTSSQPSKPNSRKAWTVTSMIEICRQAHPQARIKAQVVPTSITTNMPVSTPSPWLTAVQSYKTTTTTPQQQLQSKAKTICAEYLAITAR